MLFDIDSDAKRAFSVIAEGGIGILPMDVGYSIIGSSHRALELIFKTKKRAKGKRNAMLGNWDIHLELHEVDSRRRDIVKAITVDYDLPLGVIAPFRPDHPLIEGMGEGLSRSTFNGTIAMLMNAGAFHAKICDISLAKGVPLVGSSANLTLKGTRFCIEDIEPEIRKIADIEINYGLRKYHPYCASSTLLDIDKLEILRIGACHKDILDVVKRHFRIELN